MGNTKTLDLGCGPIIRNPYNAELVYGIDLVGDKTKNIKKADLVTQPIPFKDSKVGLSKEKTASPFH